MPAGWYWLSGRLQVADGMVAAPCLYPSYVGGADGDAQIALPDPDDTGLIRALVLFNYGVTSLRFCPVQARSEEHTSELQSLMRISYAVFCLTKKKNKTQYTRS